MLDTVLTPCKLTIVGKELVDFRRLECLVVQTDSVAGGLLQANTANGAHLCAEVTFQQVFAQSDALEYLGAAITADGADTHLAHNLLQAFVDSLDIMSLGRCIILLNLVLLHQVVQHGEGHVRTDGAGTVTQKKGCVHNLAYLAAFYNKGGLYTLAYTNKVMVNGRNGQQRGDSCVFAVDVSIREDDVVYAFVHTGFCLFAKVVDSLTKTALALLYVEQHGQFLRIETLIADIT